MKRIAVCVCAAVAALLAWGAGPSPAIVAPSPAAATFSGAITSATGRYAGAHGHVAIRDAALVAQRSGPLSIIGRACHGARHCLALSGRPSGSLTLKGHPIPDAGYTFTVRGAGRVAPLGQVTISGLLQVPGFVACGRQTMTLTLTGPRGQVKITAETPVRCVGGPPD
jgi:hypothetical protein